MSKIKRLVVISPGLGLKTRAWNPLLRALKEQPGWRDDTTEYYRHESRTAWWGTKRLGELGRDLSARMQARWVASGGFEEIILVGHSLGGLVVRQAFLNARGMDRAKPPMFAWSAAVKRIVLLAAPNRGVAELPGILRPLHWFHRRLRALHLALHHTYEDLMRGSSFISNLRIGWIRLFGTSAAPGDLPEVVQLRGTEDSIVKTDDSTDLLVFPGATPYDVPGAGHDDILDIEGLDPELARDRRALLCAAICAPGQLQASTRTTRLTPSAAPYVVIVLHGIRADRMDTWLDDVEQEVKAAFPPGTVVERPSYGYLTAREFAAPTGRRRYLRDFQDFYTEALARHPSAQFHFIGHSNGTYLLGQSLRDIPAMTFGNVALAGAVLPPDFPWDAMIVAGQVERLRSDRGQGDWPVGWLCAALRYGLVMRDIGPGGYVGFTRGTVQEEPLHPGGHSGMLTKANIIRMVRFARGLDPGEKLATQGPDDPGFAIKGRLIKYLLWALIIGLIVLGAWLGKSYGVAAVCYYVVAVLVMVFILYVGLDVA